MKVLLILSLLLNVYFFHQSKKRTETNTVSKAAQLRQKMLQAQKFKSQALIVDEVKTDQAKLKSFNVTQTEELETSKAEDFAPEIEIAESIDYEEALEKVAQDRVTLMEKVGLSSEQVMKVEKLIKEYHRQNSEMHQNVKGTYNLDVRKSFIELEENFQIRMKKVFGEKNFEKYESMRKKYNDKLFEMVGNYHGPFAIMDL